MKKDLKSVDIKRGKYRFRAWINKEKGIVAVRLIGVFKHHKIHEYSDGPQGVAKTFPGDVFDQDHGIKLAIDRALLKMLKMDMQLLWESKHKSFKDIIQIMSDLKDPSTEKTLQDLQIKYCEGKTLKP